MFIAHQDLKLENILLYTIKKEIINKTIKYVNVKLINFGMSKIVVGRNPKDRKNNYLYITIGYMVLEVLKNLFESIKLYLFKIDVYSFVIVYFKILSK